MHGSERNRRRERSVEKDRRRQDGATPWPSRSLWRRLRAVLALPAGLLLMYVNGPAGPAVSATPGNQDQDRGDERRVMVASQIQAREISDPDVLAAMEKVPRHRFVPPDPTLQASAYADTPLPIGHGQTISQPYIVAYMTAALRLPPDARVLEVGTGSGYQAAVLAELAGEVYTIEIVPALATTSREILRDLGYDNVHVRQGDGYGGWPDQAQFDGIIVTAAPDHVPPALVDQLADGARLVIPVGGDSQSMTIITKQEGGSTVEVTLPVRFVPMTGEAQR